MSKGHIIETSISKNIQTTYEPNFARFIAKDYIDSESLFCFFNQIQEKTVVHLSAIFTKEMLSFLIDLIIEYLYKIDMIRSDSRYICNESDICQEINRLNMYILLNNKNIHLVYNSSYFCFSKRLKKEDFWHFKSSSKYISNGRLYVEQKFNNISLKNIKELNIKCFSIYIKGIWSKGTLEYLFYRLNDTNIKHIQIIIKAKSDYLLNQDCLIDLYNLITLKFLTKITTINIEIRENKLKFRVHSNN